MIRIQKRDGEFQEFSEGKIRKSTGASIVGVVRDKSLTPNPGPDFKLQEGDLIAVIGNLENMESFCRAASTEPCDLSGKISLKRT